MAKLAIKYFSFFLFIISLKTNSLKEKRKEKGKKMKKNLLKNLVEIKKVVLLQPLLGV